MLGLGLWVYGHWATLTEAVFVYLIFRHLGTLFSQKYSICMVHGESEYIG